MRIRALGTGSAFCRHPLVTSSFLVQSDGANIVIGCGPNIPAKLDAINMSSEQIDMWIPLSSSIDQIGGLFEVAASPAKAGKPFITAPHTIITQADEVFSRVTGSPLKEKFELRSALKVSFSEEHFSESLSFVSNHGRGFGLFFDQAGVFITGDAPANDEFLHRHGSPAQLILHSCTLTEPATQKGPATITELQKLPIYLQSKIWLYGYENSYLNRADPIPMMFLPQGTCLFDSSRKETHLEKERFIRENSKRIIGNRTSPGALS